jgi:hypothetical protein
MCSKKFHPKEAQCRILFHLAEIEIRQAEIEIRQAVIEISQDKFSSDEVITRPSLLLKLIYDSLVYTD